MLSCLCLSHPLNCLGQCFYDSILKKSSKMYCLKTYCSEKGWDGRWNIGNQEDWSKKKKMSRGNRQCRQCQMRWCRRESSCTNNNKTFFFKRWGGKKDFWSLYPKGSCANGLNRRNTETPNTAEVLVIELLI